jgi:epimerase transport system membrane fusion protein
VSVGQEAEVRFSVFKDAYLISGSLTKLSPDRLVDQETDLPYYSAEIKLLEEDLSLLEGMSLVPGMPAEVLIKTGERTMLGYLTSPMRRGFSRSLTED